MSVTTMAFVWKLNIPHDEKFVLLAYADHANDSGGNIFPAVLTVAKKTNYSRRSIQEITNKLEKRGLLLPNGRGKHGTNCWRIPLDWGADSAPVPKSTGAQNPTGSSAEIEKGGAESAPLGAQTIAPKPSFNHHKPSEREKAAHDFSARSVHVP